MNQQSSRRRRPEATGRTLGLGERGERLLQLLATGLLLALAAGWIWSITHVRTATSQVPLGVTRTARTITSALTKPDAPSTAYLTNVAVNAAVERALQSARGKSGKLKATIQPPGAVKIESLPPGTSVRYSKNGEVVAEPAGAGIWNVVLAVGNAVRPIESFNVISML